jgi:hypothetical protein
LEQFLGSAAGLSPAAVTRLTVQWQADHAAFAERDLSKLDYVYVWADGVHLRIRLGESKACVLVLIGVRADGTKELIAMDEGYRESGESWAAVLRDCARRGMRAPVLAVGDGALGFWNGLREVFPDTVEQRCWVHRSRKGSTWWFGCLGGEGPDFGCGGKPLPGWGGGESVLVQERHDVVRGVSDGAAADVEQFGQGLQAA